MSRIDGSYCFPVSKPINIIAVIVFIFVLISFIALFYKGIKFVLMNPNVKTPKIISIPYIIICISWCLCILLCITNILITNSEFCAINGNDAIPYLSMMTAFLYYIGILHGYLLYLFRLKISFTQTHQEISKCKFISLIICYTIALILDIMSTILTVPYILNGFTADASPMLNQLLIFSGTLLTLIYIISSIILCILFIKKSLKFAKSNHKASIKHIRLGLAVKYLNCVVVTFITTLITLILNIFLSLKSAEDPSFVGITMFWFVVLYVIDGFFNVFFLHLQFKFMKSWYHMICNPFRMEINNILNKNLTDVELTTEYDDTKVSTQASTVYTDTKTSTVPNGLEPTNTDDPKAKNKTNIDEPEVSIIRNDGINIQQYYPHYFCLICPFKFD